MTAVPMPNDPLASVGAAIASIDAMPLAEQAAAFESIHRTVTQALAGAADRADPQLPVGAR